jgi:poly-gamma-glutamate synthesis protein (capsule biosynthesis protein)
MNIDQDSSGLHFAAVGDVLIAFGPGRRRDMAPAWASLRAGLDGSDVALANLECTLDVGAGTVPTEPRVFADEQALRSLPDSGVNVVTLANNHAFDGLRDGFDRVRGILEEMGIAHFGAGDDLDEACRPALLEARGVKLALLGAVDDSSGPSHLAGPGRFGVAPLDVDRLASQVGQLAGHVDHVILSLHWGRERFAIPSPKQICQARRLIDAGASMILGHHPHVLQGWQLVSGRPVLFSMGNVVVCDVPYTHGEAITWNRTERTACLLKARLSAATADPATAPESRRGGCGVVEVIPTFDTGRSVRIGPDAPAGAHRRLRRVGRLLADGVDDRDWKRETFRIETLRPILRHLSPAGLVRLRPRHIRKALRRLTRR